MSRLISSDEAMCSKCNSVKPISEFRYASGRPTECKECYNKYQREYSMRIRKERKVDWLGGRPCYVCGEDSPHVIDFHHIDPSTKEYPLSKMLKFSKEKVDYELSKCIPLCANCHRKVHAGIISLDC